MKYSNEVKTEFVKLVKSIDALNAEYILADSLVNEKFDFYTELKTKAVSYAESVYEELKEIIEEYDSKYLTPANVKVGDGATVVLFSDKQAGTIVKVAKSSITIRRDKAIKNDDFKPEFVTGGFNAVCVNQNEQSYAYEPDEQGQLTTIHWSSKNNSYGTPSKVRAIKGRHEFYDYNF